MLKNAGWLRDRRTGVWIHYSIFHQLIPIHTMLSQALRAIMEQNEIAESVFIYPGISCIAGALTRFTGLKLVGKERYHKNFVPKISSIMLIVHQDKKVFRLHWKRHFFYLSLKINRRHRLPNTYCQSRLNISD